MKIYDFSAYNKVFLTNGYDGDFTRLYYSLENDCCSKEEREKIIMSATKNRGKKIRINDRLNESIIIVSGSNKFGFTNLDRERSKLERLEGLMENINSHIIFIRGNHDDPSYFDDKKLGFSNIHCVSDYSVLKTATSNILCIGGAVSCDRLWRKNHKEYMNRFKEKDFHKIYWEEEGPVYDTESLNRLVEEGILIDFVVSHSVPSFITINEKEGIKEWLEIDETLGADIKSERDTIENVYNYLMANSMPLKGWYTSGMYSFCNCKSKDYVPFMTIGYSHDIYDLSRVIQDSNEFSSLFGGHKIKMPRFNNHHFGDMLGRGRLQQNFGMQDPVHHGERHEDFDFEEDLDEDFHGDIDENELVENEGRMVGENATVVGGQGEIPHVEEMHFEIPRAVDGTRLAATVAEQTAATTDVNNEVPQNVVNRGTAIGAIEYPVHEEEFHPRTLETIRLGDYAPYNTNFGINEIMHRATNRLGGL